MNIDKEYIANICEDVFRKLLEINPQIEDGNLMWILNGSTICNFLYNIDSIDDVEVSLEFRKNAYKFIRQPKGDIDILYTKYKRFNKGLEYEEIKKFQSISLEKRDYNFIDHNSPIDECSSTQLCKYKTKSGLEFIGKKPQYLFIYKFEELAAVYYKEILANDSNNIKSPNIIKDVTNLYNIALSYCSREEITSLINNIYNISTTLNDIYNNDISKYQKIIKGISDIVINNDINVNKKL